MRPKDFSTAIRTEDKALLKRCLSCDSQHRPRGPEKGTATPKEALLGSYYPSLLVPRVDTPLCLVACWTAIPSKSAVHEALDSKNSINLANCFSGDLQPLIGKQGVPQEQLQYSTRI